MATANAVCSRCWRRRGSNIASLIPSFRAFSTGPALREQGQLQQHTPAAQGAASSSSSHLPPPSRPLLDPNRVSSVSEEQRLLKHQRLVPIGSRRRRAALVSTAALPFEQLPYQCFQEARQVLAADRADKVKQIEDQRGRIARLEEQDAGVSGGEQHKQRRLDSMRRELERLKVLADINDPMVKKKFEDGHGDMSKPIYRHLADRKWRSYKRLVLMQRITQMKVMPDVIPHIEPTIDVDVKFQGRVIPPGDFVLSTRSEYPPTLKIQTFDKGTKMVTIVAVDADVPDLEKDGFTYRCHGIWSNITISSTDGTVTLLKISPDRTVAPWLPPFAQQGSPYHRIALFILEQPEGRELAVETLSKNIRRDGFILRSFVDKNGLKAIGVNMFRSEWDENTAAVMHRAKIPGADVVLKRKKAEKLPEKYRRKDGARYRGFR